MDLPSIDYGQTGCSGDEPFALRVVGASMVPEFADGQIVIVDPAHPVKTGMFVVVDYGGEVMFGQLLEVEGSRRLAFLNPDYEAITLAPPYVVKGVVIQRAGRRRSERKHYDYGIVA
jgi:SOS-response transcriptional repressor LexA